MDTFILFFLLFFFTGGCVASGDLNSSAVVAVLEGQQRGNNNNINNKEEVEELEEDEEAVGGGPSFSGLINGFLDTLTSISTSAGCRGRCIHPLATFMCEQVVNEGCPNNQACCLNGGGGGGGGGGGNGSSEGGGQASGPVADPGPPVSPTAEVKRPLAMEEDDEKDEFGGADDDSTKGRNKLICPGACVQGRMVEHCEDVLDDPNLCPNHLKCCVKKIVKNNKEEEETVNRGGTLAAGAAPPAGPPPPLESEEKRKVCGGECRAIIFGLFLCDEIDNEAYCPESHQGCCVFFDKNEQRRPSPIPPVRGEQQWQGQSPPPPLRGNPPPPRNVTREEVQQEEEEESAEDNRAPPPSRAPPPPQQAPLPCPTYCLPFHLRQYCQRQLNFPCGLNGFCCAHDLRPVMPPPPHRTTTQPAPPSSEEEEEEDYVVMESTTVKAVVKMEPCPGSCINAILSFTCFLNAEMTDQFACPNPKMKCCAPKTYLQMHSNNASVVGAPQIPPLPTAENNNNKNVVSIGAYNNNNNKNNNIYPQQQYPVAQQQVPVGGGQAPPPQRNFQQQSRTPISRYVCGVKGTPSAPPQQQHQSTLPQRFDVEPQRGSVHQNVLSRRKRVVGGRDSLPGEWCWQVALINSLNQYLCGAALIGTEWVLTAAHCVTNIVRSGDSIYIRVGDHDLTSKYGSPGAQTLRVATTYIHHNHNSQTLDNDIALLKLQGHVALKEGVCLVCLPSRNGVVKEIPGKRCTVTGYGYMGESGPIPLRVREADLPIVSEPECIRKVNAVTEKMFVLPASSFCAGGEYKNDACQGDGGGPLVCKEDGYYELTGLVSWGFGCGRQDVPGVYVKVSSFIGWINQIISVNNN